MALHNLCTMCAQPMHRVNRHEKRLTEHGLSDQSVRRRSVARAEARLMHTPCTAISKIELVNEFPVGID